MKNEPSFSEWKIAEILASPHEVFVLWLIHDGLCSSIEDFKAHFNTALLSDSLVSELERDGFIKRDDSKLFLTETGQKVVFCITQGDRNRAEATMHKSLAEFNGTPSPKSIYRLILSYAPVIALILCFIIIIILHSIVGEHKLPSIFYRK